MYTFIMGIRCLLQCTLQTCKSFYIWMPLLKMMNALLSRRKVPFGVDSFFILNYKFGLQFPCIYGYREVC